MKLEHAPCFLRESPLHRHDLLKRYIPQIIESILDVGGSSYIRVGRGWKRNLGPAGKSWNGTYFNNPKKGKRRILTLNVTRDYNKNRKPDLYYDGLHIPFKENEFDVVTSVDVFEHMPEADRKIVLQEMIRVAKKRVLITFPFKSTKRDLEEEVLSYVVAHGIEPKASLKEHERFGLPTVSKMEEHLKKNHLSYELFFATDKEILKQHWFHQASLNRLIKHEGINKESIIKEVKKLEKINYKELGLEQIVPQRKAYRAIIVIYKTKKQSKLNS